MRLYLAVAVLMLAFVAYTEAQEPTMEQRFATFTEQVKTVGQDLADKLRAAVEDIKTNEFLVQSQNWMREQLDTITEGVKNLGK